ncbi:MAG: N-6 DNA methylase [Dehalococcoidia bacterium]|nr:N-6 DNA methylase [Dehalococcoidia bacterium]
MDRVERDYLDSVEENHRKAFGQFFTHPKVADFMVRWVAGSKNRHVHDPGFGLGAFYKAASKHDVRLTASEIDPRVLNYWRNANPNSDIDISREDYLLSWGKAFGNVVCNPPYMRFQKFKNRDLVFHRFEEELGIKLSGYTNSASAFLVKSLSELEPPGRLAYIMPLEFLNTGYGTLIKERLIDEAHLSAIISLDCEKDVFPDSITSVGIILYDSSSRFSNVRFFTVNSIESLDSILEKDPVSEVPYSRLAPEAKWLTYFEDDSISVSSQKSTTLDYYGRFTRGIATGANEFFVLRPSDAEKLELEDSELTRIITKSSQIQKAFFTDNDHSVLMYSDEPSLLFSPNGRPSDKGTDYIEFGEQQGFHRRFLTNSRTPWYKTEHRVPSPLLLGVFSRGKFKVVRNESSALNLTCFHGFQPNLSGINYIDHIFLYLSSAVGQEIISLSMRRYGDGLNKFEPNDLNSALVPCPDVFDQMSSSDVEKALEHLDEAGATPNYIESYFEKLKE